MSINAPWCVCGDTAPDCASDVKTAPAAIGSRAIGSVGRKAKVPGEVVPPEIGVAAGHVEGGGPTRAVIGIPETIPEMGTPAGHVIGGDASRIGVTALCVWGGDLSVLAELSLQPARSIAGGFEIAAQEEVEACACVADELDHCAAGCASDEPKGCADAQASSRRKSLTWSSLSSLHFCSRLAMYLCKVDAASSFV